MPITNDYPFSFLDIFSDIEIFHSIWVPFERLDDSFIELLGHIIFKPI